jgi:glycosyltransferase involved in cell wall biosynthesis
MDSSFGNRFCGFLLRRGTMVLFGFIGLVILITMFWASWADLSPADGGSGAFAGPHGGSSPSGGLLPSEDRPAAPAEPPTAARHGRSDAEARPDRPIAGPSEAPAASDASTLRFLRQFFDPKHKWPADMPRAARPASARPPASAPEPAPGSAAALAAAAAVAAAAAASGSAANSGAEFAPGPGTAVVSSGSQTPPPLPPSQPAQFDPFGKYSPPAAEPPAPRYPSFSGHESAAGSPHHSVHVPTISETLVSGRRCPSLSYGGSGSGSAGVVPAQPLLVQNGTDGGGVLMPLLTVVVATEGNRLMALNYCLQMVVSVMAKARVPWELQLVGVHAADLSSVRRYSAVRSLVSDTLGQVAADIDREDHPSLADAFSAGGLRARGLYVMFLSETSVVEEESASFFRFLLESVTTPEAELQIGVVGPLLSYVDGRVYAVGGDFMVSGYPRRTAATPVDQFDPDRPNVAMPYLRYTGLLRSDARVRAVLEGGVDNSSALTEVFIPSPVLSAEGMLLSTSMFRQLEGFDVSFSDGYIAADLCLSASLTRTPVSLARRYAVTLYPSPGLESRFEFLDDGLDALRFANTWGRSSSLMAHARQAYRPELGGSLLLVWSMECGANFELGFTTESFYFLLGLMDQMTVRVEAHEWMKCKEAIRPAFPAFLLHAIDRLTRINVNSPDVSALPIASVVHRVPTRYWYAFNEPRGRDIDYVIGRSMFESDRIDPDWVHILNGFKVNEVWVPSEFNRETFSFAGVNADKLVVVPESLDIQSFDPDLPIKFSLSAQRGDFVFLSVMKWEPRKCWECLVNAYVDEFTNEDSVSLVVRTNVGSDAEANTRAYAAERLAAAGRSNETMPRFHFVRLNLPMDMLPSLYASADCLVQPTRGEGWGRPMFEAMAMGTPVIATNWSGHLQFMNQNNSFLINVTGLVDMGPKRPGHRWAQPDGDSLRQLLRAAYADPAATRAKGVVGREHIRRHFSVEAVTPHLVERLEKVVVHLADARASKRARELASPAPATAPLAISPAPADAGAGTDEDQDQDVIDTSLAMAFPPSPPPLRPSEPLMQPVTAPLQGHLAHTLRDQPPSIVAPRNDGDEPSPIPNRRY